MRIGIFDSGIGGLLVAREIIAALPEYDYIYLGDTARVPYGNRSRLEIEKFLQEAVEFLFAQDCALVVVACNTASAQALHALQQNWLPDRAPDRRVLGVLVPAIEAAIADGARRVGVLGTAATISSGAFTREFTKHAPDIKVFEQAAPRLVPMIENDDLENASKIISEYLEPLLAKKIDTLILGCTHYPVLAAEFCAALGPDIKMISQDKVVPLKLKKYLERHPEITDRLTKNSDHRFFVTANTPAFIAHAKNWFGVNINLQQIML